MLLYIQKIAWRKTALVVVLLVVGLKVTAQQIQHKISADQRRQEVELIKKSFISLQPGLYRYNSPEQINSYFDEMLKKVSGTINDPEYFKESLLILTGYGLVVVCPEKEKT